MRRAVAAAGRAEESIAEAERTAGALTEGVERVVGSAVWQWRAALSAIALLGVLSTVLVLWSVPRLGSPQAPATPYAAMPFALHSANCRRSEPEAVHCAIAANDPLLAGDIAGGRELIFTLRTVSPDRLAADLRRWRSGGAVVVADGAVFAAIGAGSTVWYADTRSGVRIDTAAFAGPSAARIFLSRSGLLA
ncbi:hypothetical protein ACWDOP_14930 [Nocardia sp. NPDC003693]